GGTQVLTARGHRGRDEHQPTGAGEHQHERGPPARGPFPALLALGLRHADYASGVRHTAAGSGRPTGRVPCSTGSSARTTATPDPSPCESATVGPLLR